MVVQQRRMTIEEFMALPDDGNLQELVRGEVYNMPPPKGAHGFIEAAIIEAIGRYLSDRASAAGWQPQAGLSARHALVGRLGGGELGLRFSVPDDADMVRAADVAYIPPDQLARVAWDAQEYFPAVPALVIEIISETDRASMVAEKVQDYLAGGGRRVWCVYPEQRAVHIHDADASTRVIRGEGNLTDELLPGFSLPLNLIFG